MELLLVDFDGKRKRGDFPGQRLFPPDEDISRECRAALARITFRSSARKRVPRLAWHQEKRARECQIGIVTNARRPANPRRRSWSPRKTEMFAPKTVSMALAAALLSFNAIAAPGEHTADGFVAGAEEGGYSLAQYRYFTTGEEGRGTQAFTQRSARPAPAVRDGFEFVAGETGSQPLQHKYVLQGGKLVHSGECDHAIRVVSAPTAREIEAGRLFSPGA